jgi:hypothetical protein
VKKRLHLPNKVILKDRNEDILALVVVAHTCHPSTWKAEDGGSPVQGQPELHSKILSQKKKRTEKEKTVNEETSRKAELLAMCTVIHFMWKGSGNQWLCPLMND